MKRKRKKLRILNTLEKTYLIDPNSMAIWKTKGGEPFELVDIDVVKFAIRHMRPFDRLNPVKVGLAVLESWQLMYEWSPICECIDPEIDDLFMEEFYFKF